MQCGGQDFRGAVEHRHAATLELAHVLGVEHQLPGIGRQRLIAQRRLHLGGVDADRGVAPKPVDEVLVAGVEAGNLGLNIGIEVFQVGQQRFVEFAQQAAVHLQPSPVRRRHHNVVTGLASHQLGVQDLVVVKGVIADLDAGFLLEILDGVSRDVVRPVVNVEHLGLLRQDRSGRTGHRARQRQTGPKLAAQTGFFDSNQSILLKNDTPRPKSES